MRIVFTGGGTGGHIMPIIAISRELKKIYQKDDLVLYYVSPKNDFELLSKENFKLYSITAGKIRRYFSFLNVIDILFKIPFSFLQGLFLLLLIRPKLVFSKGGTGSLPITYCARIFKIPVFIHESDMAPGLSNKITSKWAKKVFISFERTEYFNKDKTILVGNPIRKELLSGNIEEARKQFSLNFGKPVILILGGSQGAKAINDFILLVLNSLLQNYQVIHVAGSNNYREISIQSKLILSDKELLQNYHLYEFLNEVELRNAYLSSDIIISRAGSGSIFEIAALGKPCILIPLPGAANDHQSKNAYQYANSGAAIVIEQESLSPNFFMGEIESAISRSKKMKEAALNFAKPDAAENITKEIKEKDGNK